MTGVKELFEEAVRSVWNPTVKLPAETKRKQKKVLKITQRRPGVKLDMNIVKFVLVGDTFAGKSSALHRYIHGVFPDVMYPTTIACSQKAVNADGLELKLDFWGLVHIVLLFLFWCHTVVFSFSAQISVEVIDLIALLICISILHKLL